MKSVFRILLFSIFCLTTKSMFAVDPMNPENPDAEVDSIKISIEHQNSLLIPTSERVAITGEGEFSMENDSLYVFAFDSTKIAYEQPEWVERKFEFVPDPKRAVWLSALFPGLGQIYNRRYWKLPIVVGGYLGLAYAMNWNSTMLKDYTNAYADIMDNDPNTKSYMDFFPPSVKEENIDRTWLTNVLKNRKDYFRRNRDLCVICMVGVYLIAMVDAYVDASLAHFDISPDLSLDWAPTLIPDSRDQFPSFGIQWAVNF